MLNFPASAQPPTSAPPKGAPQAQPNHPTPPPSDFARLIRSLSLYAALGLVVGMLLTAIPIVLMKLSVPSTLVAQRVIDFTFPGAEDGTYPNGRAFSMQDLLTPGVVSDTFTAMDFKRLGVSLDDFRNGLTIEPFAPTYEERAEAFRKRFRLDEITATETELIEEKMREALAKLTQTSAKIRLRLDADQGVTQEVAEQAVSKLIENWASYSVRELGVNALPIAMSRRHLVSAERIASIDLILVSHLFRDAGTNLLAHLDKIQALNDTQNLMTAQSQQTLSDLKRDFEVLNSFGLEPFRQKVAALGLSQDWQNTQLWADQSIRTLRAERGLLAQKAVDLSEAALFYKSLNRREDVPTTRLPEQDVVIDTIVGTNMRSTDAFTNQVFEIAKKNQHQDFLQGLVNDQLAVQGQLGALDLEINELELFKTNAEARGNQQQSEALQSALLDKARLANELNSLWARANAILETANAARMGSLAGIFTYVGEDKSSFIFHPILNKRSIVLFFVMTVAIAVIFTLFGFGRFLMRSLMEDARQNAIRMSHPTPFQPVPQVTPQNVAPVTPLQVAAFGSETPQSKPIANEQTSSTMEVPKW